MMEFTGRSGSRTMRQNGVHRMLGTQRLFAVFVGALLLALGVADAASAAPVWRLKSAYGPTTLRPGDEAQLAVQVFNVGDAAPDFTGTVRVEPPRGIEVVGVQGIGWTCTDTFPSETATCSNPFLALVALPPQAGTPLGVLQRGAGPRLGLTVRAAADLPAGTRGPTRIEMSGGGALRSTVELVSTEIGTEEVTFGLAHGQLETEAFDGAGDDAAPVVQAGDHPFEYRVRFDMNLGLYTDVGGTYTRPVEEIKNVEVRLPLGFIGNPEATPKCTVEELVFPAAPSSVNGHCPPASQVGTVDALLQNGPTLMEGDVPNYALDLPVYNMVPPKDAVAAFAFAIQGVPIWMIASLDPANNYAVRTTLTAVTNALPVRSIDLRLWGLPGDPAHDDLRWRPIPGGLSYYGTPSNGPSIPFLTLPSDCSVDTATTLTLDSWQRPGRFLTYHSSLGRVTGCDRQEFRASFGVETTSNVTDSPSGLSVDLRVDQDLGPRSLGTPPLRRAVVRFPPGLSVSPSSADGLQACTLAQIKLGTDEEPTCPGGAKIGTVRIETPLLARDLTGEVLLAAQDDNPFRSLIALYVVARGPGVLVKLPGRVDLDPSTGQMTAVFDDTPQIPFSNLHLELKTGPRAPLALPRECGTYAVRAELTSWNPALPPVVSEDTFTVTRPDCGERFAPRLEAGTIDSTGGAASPFTMTLTRDDGDDYLKGLEIATPRGFTGKIADVPLCPEAQAAAGTCGEESRIGTVTTGAGPGPNPFFVRGRAYLTGPYKGAPFGMSMVVPAIAGPFDLGTIVVRAAIFVDRHTAELRVVSDPLPTILQGIPLRIRSVEVLLDRPGFTINPTNCSRMEIRGRATSERGLAASLSVPFRATDCATLEFRPRLTFRIGRRGRTQRNRTTPVTTVLTIPPGNANIRRVNVTLPASLNARLTVVREACAREEYEAGTCRAIVGTAVAETPLLSEPLTGTAYFVRREGEILPDLVVALRGQIDFDLVGRVTIPGGRRLGTDFTMVPDVPVSRFTLNLIAGRRGSIGTAENLCTRRARARRADVRYAAQNGKRLVVRPKVSIVGCQRAAGRRQRRARARNRARRTRAFAQLRAATKAARRAG